MTLSNDFVLQRILRLCFTRFHARMVVHYSGIPPISPTLVFVEIPGEPKKLDLQTTSLYQSQPVINQFELISFSQDGSKNRDSSTQINLINL